MYLTDVPSCGAPVAISWVVATTYRLPAHGNGYQLDYLILEGFEFFVSFKLLPVYALPSLLLTHVGNFQL
jgi:hypothetical protein